MQPSVLVPLMSAARQQPHATVAFALSMLMTGCDEQSAATVSTEAEDRIVYEDTHKTLATVPLFAYVTQLFRADTSWLSLDAKEAASAALFTTAARLEVVLGSFGCTRQFEFDRLSSLSGTFSNCPGAEFNLEGAFDADLVIERGPCPDRDAECNLAVRWTLPSPTFSVGLDTEKEPAHFVGPVVLRDSIVDRDAPMTWETLPGFSLQASDGAKFATRSTASWLVDEATNCMDIDLDARLQLPDSRLHDIDIGEIVISATEVHFCPTHCPTQGAIEMAYGRGSILSWHYDGGVEVIVSGPGGREFTAELPCVAAP